MSTMLLSWFGGLGVALALVTLVWVLSLVKHDASIMDIFWGSGFALLACVYAFFVAELTARSWLALGMVSLWGLRLSIHILVRSIGKEEDYRYREMREKHGDQFPLVSLATIFLLQGVLLWLISAPLLQAIQGSAPAGLGWLDYAALGLFAVGFLFETLGDLQLSRFRANPANRGKVMASGLWRYTRHPNYFGDAVVWWSFFLLALATSGSVWTIFSPILMTALLLKVSGVSLLEKKLQRTRPEYADYAARTNAFLPWFPRQPQPSGEGRR